MKTINSKRRSVKSQISTLFNKIFKSQNSLTYHYKKVRSHHREMLEMVSLLKTACTCLIQASPGPGGDSQVLAGNHTDQYTSDTDSDTPTTSKAVKKRNLERQGIKDPILISDDEAANAQNHQQTSVQLAQYNDIDQSQPMSQNTMLNNLFEQSLCDMDDEV